MIFNYFILICFCFLLKNVISLTLNDKFLYCKKLNLFNINDVCTSDDSYIFNVKCSYVKAGLLGINEYEDEFHLIEYKDYSFVVYSNNGELFNTSCIKINSVEILDKVDVCVADVYLNFYYENNKKEAFLSKNGIIRDTSKEIKCNNEYYYFNNIENHLILKKKRYQIEAINLGNEPTASALTNEKTSI